MVNRFVNLHAVGQAPKIIPGRESGFAVYRTRGFHRDSTKITQKLQAKDGQAVHTCGSFRAKPQIGMCLVTRGATRSTSAFTEIN